MRNVIRTQLRAEVKLELICSEGQKHPAFPCPSYSFFRTETVRRRLPAQRVRHFSSNQPASFSQTSFQSNVPLGIFTRDLHRVYDSRMLIGFGCRLRVTIRRRSKVRCFTWVRSDKYFESPCRRANRHTAFSSPPNRNRIAMTKRSMEIADGTTPIDMYVQDDPPNHVKIPVSLRINNFHRLIFRVK